MECQICIMSLIEEDFWGLECGHCFHKECLQGYFKNAITERKFPIKCPEQNCKEEVLYQDLAEILSPEDLDKFNSYTFSNYVDANTDQLSWCPTADCKYVFVLEDVNNENNKDFTCPICKKRYCLTCKVDFHEGMSCKEY